MGSVAHEGNVNNRGAGNSNKLSASELEDVFGDKKGQSREEDDSVATPTVVKPSTEHGFEVGDMVWGKVKSHPWWPGHVFREELATTSVRRSKRDGLLLVAFFGDSSYGWFDSSELVPFDSNFDEKSHQTNSKAFAKALEEAIDEVRRRSGLGLSCMCPNSKNFRQTSVQGYYAADVVGYEPGAVYSTDTIKKARDSFQPRLAMEFLKQLAMEPTDEHDDIDFIKNKAIVLSYRRAVYQEVDETYAEAFGDDSDRPSSGSMQVSTPGKKPSKAPLSGRQVFADTASKVKSPAKSNKKDKYLFKRRDEPKETKLPQNQPFEGQTIANADDLPLKDATMEDESPSASSVVCGLEKPAGELSSGKKKRKKDSVMADNGKDDASLMDKVDPQVAGELGSGKPASPEKKKRRKKESLLPDTTNINEKDDGSMEGKVPIEVAGELSSGKSVSPEKKKKRKKESLVSDSANVIGKDGGSMVENVSIEDPQNEVARESSSGRSVSPDKKKKRKKESLAAEGGSMTELPRVLADLHSLALDPFHTTNRKFRFKIRQVFLKFRSLVFQKSLNSVAESVTNDTRDKPLALAATDVTGAPPPEKPQVRPPGRPDDPTIGGIKREELAAKKKKKLAEIKNSTDSGGRQAAVMKSRKPGPEVRQRVPEPTMLIMKFPPGGSLPSISELKAKFTCYGSLDLSGTRIFWKTFTCRVVYKYKADAEAAMKVAAGSGGPFGNDVKYSILKVGDFEYQPPKASTDHQPAVEDRAAATTPDLPLKSCLKKSGEEGGGSGGRMTRVKFDLTGDESHNSKNFQKSVLPLSLPISTSVTSSTSTAQFTPPPPLPPSSTQYVAPPPPSRNSVPLAPPSQNSVPLTPPSRNSVPLAPPSRNSVPLTPPSLPPPRKSVPLAPPSLPPPRNSVPLVPPPRSSVPLAPPSRNSIPLAPPSLSQPRNIIPLAPPLLPPVRSLAMAPPPPPPLPLPPPLAPPLLPPPRLNRPAGDKDIAQQMVSLLTKCNDVVANVTGFLGYVPYHPL